MKNIFKNKKALFFVFFVILGVFSICIYKNYEIKYKMFSIHEKNLDIPVFVYHDIVDDKSKIEFDYMHTDKETFEKHVKGLIDNNYHVITYKDLVDYSENKEKIHERSCVITFDDGYKGVYNNAFPIAKKYNIPITVFVITDRMGEDDILTWEQAKEMKDSGLVTIASHSTKHSDFTTLTTEEAVSDVLKSYDVIDEKLGKSSLRIFTYPYGLHTKEQVLKLSEKGIVQNLTDNKINASNKLNLYSLHRTYPLNDSIFKILFKTKYRSVRYK